ncbi:hypothetical protein [Nonomuraea sp. NPDC049607]|uniref:hypothetical protein n=1 Tax=Nonomuraea sp. NPDC049607 TaxID=3154732 RepID=UPI003422BF48
MVWETIKKNFVPAPIDSFPWKLTVLDLSTSAALTSAALAVLLARSQLSRTNTPNISYNSYAQESSHIKRSRRVGHIYNSGSGQTVIRLIKYRCALMGPGSEQDRFTDWLTWGQMVEYLGTLNLQRRYDYWLLNLGNGAGLPHADNDMELVAFNRRSLLVLAEFDVLIRVEDILGDQHQRVLRFLGREKNIEASRQPKGIFPWR